jgi:hypothetical protein
MKPSPTQLEPAALADLYLADSELAHTDTSLDLIDFAGGRNTVCRLYNLHRSQTAPSSHARIQETRIATPLPPPRPFRRTRQGGHRPRTAVEEPMNSSTSMQAASINQAIQYVMERDFDEDLFTFLIASQSAL